MLKVIQVGAASVAIDSLLPKERLRGMVRQVDAKLILYSEANKDLATRLVDTQIVPLSEKRFVESSPT